MSAPISPGSSGSPIVSLSGDVIGIAVGKWRGDENLNFAVPINYARGLISLAPGTTMTVPSTSGGAIYDVEGKGKTIEQLRDVKKIAMSSFGVSEAALLVREKLINRLARSNTIAIVDEPQDADAILSGVVGQDVYGRADASVFRLKNSGGRILWSDETSSKGLGSASSSVAGKIADKLLQTIEKDRKVSKK